MMSANDMRGIILELLRGISREGEYKYCHPYPASSQWTHDLVELHSGEP